MSANCAVHGNSQLHSFAGRWCPRLYEIKYVPPRGFKLRRNILIHQRPVSVKCGDWIIILRGIGGGERGTEKGGTVVSLYEPARSVID